MSISVPKMTQGIAPRPKPVRVLLSLYGSDLRSVVWWRGVSLKILATIKLLSPGLLGGIVTSFVETKVNKDMHGLTFHKNQPIKHLMLLRKLYPKIKGRPYSFPLMECFPTFPHKIYHLWLVLKVHWLKGNHKLDFLIRLSHPNHFYK